MTKIFNLDIRPFVEINVPRALRDFGRDEVKLVRA